MVAQQQQEVKSTSRCKQETAKLHTEILKGMSDGDTITFPNMAEQIPGVLPGDVVVQIAENLHAKFKKQGGDLHLTMKSSSREALLGLAFRGSTEHLDGSVVELRSPEGKIVGPGQVFKATEEGMPFKGDGTQFGKLSAKVQLETPKKLAEEQEDLVGNLIPEERHKMNDELWFLKEGDSTSSRDNHMI